MIQNPKINLLSLLHISHQVTYHAILNGLIVLVLLLKDLNTWYQVFFMDTPIPIKFPILDQELMEGTLKLSILHLQLQHSQDIIHPLEFSNLMGKLIRS